MFNHSVSTCFSQQCQQLSFFMNAPSAQVCTARLPSLSRFPSCLESMTVHKAALAKCSAAADSGDAAHFHQIWFSHVITSHLIPCHQMSNDHGSSPAPGLVRASQILGTKSKSKKRQCPMGNLPWRPASAGSETLTGLPNSSFIQSRMRLTSSPSVGHSSCHFDSQWAETCHWIHSAVPLGSASHPFCCL